MIPLGPKAGHLILQFNIPPWPPPQEPLGHREQLLHPKAGGDRAHLTDRTDPGGQAGWREATLGKQGWGRHADHIRNFSNANKTPRGQAVT